MNVITEAIYHAHFPSSSVSLRFSWYLLVQLGISWHGVDVVHSILYKKARSLPHCLHIAFPSEVSCLLACSHKMSPFSRLSVIPSLPTYTGPYQVGTQNIEIPIADLYSPTPPPNPKISTVSFRLFYPCHDQQKKRTSTVYWLPEPQGEYWRAYARFLSASPWLASLLRCGRPLHQRRYRIFFPTR